MIGIESEIKNLDVRSSVDANTLHLSGLFLQSLISFDENLLPDPDLAERFEVENAKKYTFYLPKNAKFHDGVSLTSADVEYSFRQASTSPSNAKAFEDVESFSSPDPYTFVITLKSPRASFLMGDVERIKIFPKHLGMSDVQKKQPIGSGPFQFVKRHDRDLIFKRFDDYVTHRKKYIGKSPTYSQLIVRMVQDQTIRFLSVIGGDIDMTINALPFRKAVEAKKNPHLSVHTSPGSSYTYVGMNLSNNKFKDPRVRLALSKALDRRKIIDHKFFGLAQIGTAALPPSNAFFNPNIKPIEYDPEGAKKLLQQAKQENLEIEVKISSDREVGSIMQILKKYWEDIGIKVTIKPFEFGTFFSDIKNGNFEVYMLRWTALVEPDVLYYIFHSKETPPGRNRVHYKNTQVDTLLTLARIEENFEKRRELYWKAQEIIFADIPYIPLWYPYNVAVGARYIEDFDLQSSAQWTGLLFSKKGSPP